MMNRLFPKLAVLAFTAQTAIAHRSSGWDLPQLKTLVTFGDSFTDESRLGYFGEHGGEAPPVGWDAPESNATSTGGRIWARYVAQYTGAELYNYAVSGAVCSNSISPRTWESIDAPFPAVQEYEIPAFIADSRLRSASDSGEPYLNLPTNETVYAIWIGTNDLGNYAFLTDSQIEGKTLVDYANCIYQALDRLHENGARNFVLMNLAPLQLLPQYAVPEAGGREATQYWPEKPDNITEISYRMWENVATLNELFDYKTMAEVLINDRYPDSQVALFDTNALISDIYYHPEDYLNGTAPLNVEGYVNHCNLQGANCTQEPSPDSYLWYDELHPSEQATRIIAQNFVDVVKGESEYATYFSS